MDIYELISILKHAQTVDELDEYQKKIIELFPCCRVMVGYNQNHWAHQYDLWYHSLHTVLNLPELMHDDMLYLAALLHDVGKPDCRTDGTKNPDAHYFGHPKRSAQIVREEAIPTLHQRGIILPEEEQQRLLYYVRHHDDWLMSLNYRPVRRHLEQISLPVFRRLLHLQIADGEAHNPAPFIKTHIRTCKIWLAITGNDYRDILSDLTDDERIDVMKIKTLQDSGLL